MTRGREEETFETQKNSPKKCLLRGIVMGNKRGTFCAKLTLNILNPAVVFIDRKPDGIDRKCL